MARAGKTSCPPLRQTKEPSRKPRGPVPSITTWAILMAALPPPGSSGDRWQPETVKLGPGVGNWCPHPPLSPPPGVQSLPHTRLCLQCHLCLQSETTFLPLLASRVHRCPIFTLLWSESKLLMISVPFNLLRLILLTNLWSILVNILCALENVHFAYLGCSIL